MAPWDILLENPMYGVIAITLVYAVVFQLLMKKPQVEKNLDPSFDSLLQGEGGDDDWGGVDEDDKEKPLVPLPEKLPSLDQVSLQQQSQQQQQQQQQPMSTAPVPIMETKNGANGQQTVTIKLGDRPAPKPKPPLTDGPYVVGDRVVLKGLMSTGELNGRHGVIGGPRDKKTLRYPVDLDVGTYKKPSVSVKEGNMEPEAPLPSVKKGKQGYRAKANNACLEPHHSRTVSFILANMRNMTSNTLKGEKNDLKLTSFGWAFWQTPDGRGVYPSLSKFMREDIVKLHGIAPLEKQLSPEMPDPKGQYQLCIDAQDDIRAVKGWSVRHHGEFYIMGINKEGTYVIPCNNTRAVYLVLGLRVPLGVQLAARSPRPPKFRLTLLPWYGRIVHDIGISTTTGNSQVAMAEPEEAIQLMKNLRLAEEEGRVIDRFAQLEIVKGANTQGVPFPEQCPPRPPGAPNPDAQQQQQQQPHAQLGKGDFPVPNQPLPVPTNQEPATEAELKLMDNVADFDPFPLNTAPGNQQTPQEKVGIWNFIRKGETEESNPAHEIVMINANGQGMGTFKTKAIEPTSVEILRAMLGIAAKAGKRPSALGVDDRKCATRLQFLFNGTKGTVVLPIQVTRKIKPKE